MTARVAAVVLMAAGAIAWAFFPTTLPMQVLTAAQTGDHYAAVKMELARRLAGKDAPGLRLAGGVPDGSPFSIACHRIPLLLMYRLDGRTVLQVAHGARHRYPPTDAVRDLLQAVFGAAAMEAAEAALPRPGAAADFVLAHRDGIDSQAACVP